MKPTQIAAAVAAVVIVAAGAIYYYTSRTDEVSLVGSGEDGASATTQADSPLMQAGPLGEMAMGDPNAPNVVIEYASMTCSHCQNFHETTFTPFKEKYIDTGKVYFILREFPLDPLATSAIMLARCAPEERFFPIVDLLFEEQRNWAFVPDPVSALRNLVKQAGISEDDFRACLTNQEILDGVNWVKNRAAGDFDVGSTPTFFVNGEMVTGALPLEEFDKILGG